jgi:hypothetical protein
MAAQTGTVGEIGKQEVARRRQRDMMAKVNTSKPQVTTGFVKREGTIAEPTRQGHYAAMNREMQAENAKKANLRITETTYRGKTGHLISGTTASGHRPKVFTDKGRAHAEQVKANLAAGRDPFHGTSADTTPKTHSASEAESARLLAARDTRSPQAKALDARIAHARAAEEAAKGPRLVRSTSAGSHPSGQYGVNVFKHPSGTHVSEVYRYKVIGGKREVVSITSGHASEEAAIAHAKEVAASHAVSQVRTPKKRKEVLPETSYFRASKVELEHMAAKGDAKASAELARREAKRAGRPKA